MKNETKHGDEIVWQELIGQTLLTQKLFALVKNQKLPPVLLLEGRSGIGKSMLAAALVARHFCDASNACGVCKGCQWVQSGNHPEVLWIDSKGSTLKVADSEEIMEHLDYAPQAIVNKGDVKPVRIVVVVDIDLMNEIAVNKLLKLLEEPSEFARIILTTSRAHSLLPTLLSRVHKWKVKPPEIDETIAILKRTMTPQELARFDSERLIELVKRNGLSPGKSITAIRELDLTKFSENCRGMVDPDRILSVLNIADENQALKKTASEISREAEVALNQKYRGQFLGKLKPKVPESIERIQNRRKILSEIKFMAGRKKVALNSQLASEGIGLSKFELG